MTLTESLSKYNKAITVEEIDEFKSVYLEFVSVYLPQNEVIAKAQKFLRNYQEIERYVHRTSSLEEFKGQVKAELYRFASELFSNAERSDLRYSDSPENVFTYAQDAFAYSRLSTIHQEIWSILHEPLWLLSTEKMIVALTLTEQPHRGDFAEEEKRAFRMNELGMLLSERIRQLKQRIGIVHFSLQERFQNIPLLCDFEIETIAEFVSSYNVCCPHVYGVEPLNTQRLYHAIRVGMVSNEAQNNLVMTLEIWALILKLECQIITLYLVDKAVECLAKEHNLLMEFQ